EEDLLDAEPLAHLDTRLGRGVDEQLVEYSATRRVRDRVVTLSRSAFDHERAHVERVAMNGWAVRRHEPLEQTPALHRRATRRVDQVRRDGVAREGRSVDHEDVMALASEEHGGG